MLVLHIDERKVEALREKYLKGLSWAIETANRIPELRAQRKYPKEKVYRELVDLLGEDRVTMNKAICAVHGTNTLCWKYHSPPDIIAIPLNTEEVQEIVRIANKYKVPITPSASGQSFGSVIPHLGGILLDMQHMKYLKIIPEEDIAVIEPGVSYAELCLECHKYGYTFPLGTFPPFTSVIGNIFFASGGIHRRSIHGGKPGGLTEVLGIQVVLPDGELLVLGSDDPPYWWTHSYIGPYWQGLFYQSAGTLGIVTKAAIRIWKRCEEERLLVYGSPSFKNTFNFCQTLARNWLAQDIFVLHWGWAIYKKHRVRYTNELAEDAIKARHMRDPPPGVPYNFISIMLEGFKEDVDTREKVIDRIAAQNGIRCIPLEELKAKWPWLYEHFEVWYLKNLPVRLEPYGGITGSFAIMSHVPTHKVLEIEEYEVDHMLQKIEDEHPGWICATGYLAWPVDGGRLWFFRTVEFLNDFSDDPALMTAIKEEASTEIMATHMPVLRALGWMGGVAYPGFDMAAIAAADYPGPYKLWKKIKKALDPNDVMNPSVLMAVPDNPEEG